MICSGYDSVAWLVDRRLGRRKVGRIGSNINNSNTDMLVFRSGSRILRMEQALGFGVLSV